MYNLSVLISRFVPSFLFFSVFGFQSCAVYDVDTATNKTLSGSINRAVNKDRGRVVRDESNEEDAPVYIDYSKSNPLLRHDDEYKEKQSYESEDPFEEKIEYSDFEKLKKRQQAKRNMEKSHEIKEPEDQPMSLW